MLKDTLFPVGGLTKKEVRDIAMKAGLQRVARKKEVGISLASYPGSCSRKSLVTTVLIGLHFCRHSGKIEHVCLPPCMY